MLTEVGWRDCCSIVGSANVKQKQLSRQKFGCYLYISDLKNNREAFKFFYVYSLQVFKPKLAKNVLSSLFAATL